MPKWIYTQPILPKCHSPHFLSPTSFFSRSVAHPSKICKQKHLSKFQKQFKFPLQTQKESKQNNPPSAHPQNAQKQNQKDTTIHFIQPPQLEKLTSSTPPNSPQTTVKIPETAKRKYVSSQTVVYDKLFTEPVAVAVVTDEGKGIRELKNLAVAPHWQRKGYGRQMVEYLCQRYQNVCHTLTVGTGDSHMTISFYQNCGFVYSHTVPDFFTLHYDHPIVEDGKVLKDMYYFSRTLTQTNETDG